MNKFFTIDELSAWIADIKKAAKRDDIFTIDWFPGTKSSPVSIVGGWSHGFSHEHADLFCCSKEDPTYAMCVKVAINKTPYAYTDFDLLLMPLDSRGDVDDTCITLEWDDDPKMVAQFFMVEWERIMESYE